MNRIMLLLIAATIGLAAQADYSVTTQQPIYPAQAIDYSALQPYAQSYGQPYGQTYTPQYNQGYYQNPYQTQCQGQYINPYQYRNPYYANNVPSSIVNSVTSGLGNTGGSAARNIGQSVLFSLLRGF